MDNLFGLPAHPLLVHIPVVLIPLLLAAVLAMVVRPAWRKPLSWWVTGLSFVTLVATFLAAESGEALEDAVERKADRALLHAHTELGDQMRPIMGLFFLAILGWTVVGYLADRRAAAEPAGGAEGSTTASAGSSVGSLRKATAALGVVAVLTGALSTVWVIRVGHSGARSSWHGITVKGEGGGEDNEGSARR